MYYYYFKNIICELSYFCLYHYRTDLLHGGQTPPYGTFPCTLTPSTSSCNSSPSSRPKRYILAATVKREVGTQTVLDVEDLETDGPLSTSELQDVLSHVKYRNETLNKENEVSVYMTVLTYKSHCTY